LNTDEWPGEHFDEEEGPRKWTIFQEQLGALEQVIQKAQFMSLRNRYTEYSVTDHASASITVGYEDDTVKKVAH
jgi:hypothetical protein